MIVVPQVSVAADRVLFGSGDAIEVARTFAANGARSVQLRDAAGGLGSSAADGAWLASFVAAVDVPVQFDGALTDPRSLERVAAAGFATIVVGQQALFDPLALRWAADLVGDRLVVELKGDGDHLFDPPRSAGHLELLDAARQLRFQGVRHLLYRDVTGLVLPVDRLRALCEDLDLDVTFTGLVRSLEDLRTLAAIGSRHLVATVVGEPLYDGRIGLTDANRACR